MNFVCEYIPETDMVLYQLFDLYDRFAPDDFAQWYRDGSVYRQWVIDRCEGTFLICLGQFEGTMPNGLIGFIPHFYFLLSLRGDLVKFEVREAEDSSSSTNDRPFYKVWKDFDLLENHTHLSRDELLPIIKEALTAWKANGVDKYNLTPQVVVNFRF